MRHGRATAAAGAPAAGLERRHARLRGPRGPGARHPRARDATPAARPRRLLPVQLLPARAGLDLPARARRRVVTTGDDRRPAPCWRQQPRRRALRRPRRLRRGGRRRPRDARSTPAAIAQRSSGPARPAARRRCAPSASTAAWAPGWIPASPTRCARAAGRRHRRDRLPAGPGDRRWTGRAPWCAALTGTRRLRGAPGSEARDFWRDGLDAPAGHDAVAGPRPDGQRLAGLPDPGLPHPRALGLLPVRRRLRLPRPAAGRAGAAAPVAGADPRGRSCCTPPTSSSRATCCTGGIRRTSRGIRTRFADDLLWLPLPDGRVRRGHRRRGRSWTRRRPS